MTRRTSPWWLPLASVLAAALLLSGLAPLAVAQEPTTPPDDASGGGEAPAASEFDTLVLEAAEAYGNRDYARALDLFEKAYAIDAVPDLLYNMGVIADRMGDFDRALKYLNQFVVSPDIDLDARKDALSRIEQLKQLKALQSPTEPDPDEKKPDEKKPDEVVEGPPALPPEPPEEPDYVGPGIVMGLGLATLAAGGVTGGLALVEHDAFESATDLDERREAADTGETLALVSDILLPTGAALTAAGIIWLAIEATSAETVETRADAASVQLAPSLSPEALGLNLRVGF